MAARSGVLYLCATPIGNLEDITLRVLRVLRRVSLIAAEDTRRTRKLLARYRIRTPLTSYHEHNQHQKGEYLLGLLRGGLDIALVADAGMPGISDPGYDLVRAALAAGFQVVPLPGPSAVLTALVVSGLPPGRFVFEGFLPRSPGERWRRLQELAAEPRTMVFYEAPHRLQRALADMEAAWGQRPVAVVREVTKVHEEVVRGQLREVRLYFEQKPPRGEITIVAAGAPAQVQELKAEEVVARVEELIRQGKQKKEAIKEVAREYSLRRREVYQAVLSRCK